MALKPSFKTQSTKPAKGNTEDTHQDFLCRISTTLGLLSCIKKLDYMTMKYFCIAKETIS